MRLPVGLAQLEGAHGALAFATPEVEAWVRRTLERGERLSEAAAREAEALLRGRGPVPVFSTSRGRWVVRRYRRGGRLAGPLLGERYVRLGLARPVREARASEEVRRRGIPTPRVVAGAVYPAGPFYRADLVTEFVPDAIDLARLLFDVDEKPRERVEVLTGVGRLVARAAAAGVEHVDLNATNILVESFPGGTSPLFVDLDRCMVFPAGTSADPKPMLARLARSLRKTARRCGRRVEPHEWAALEHAAYGGKTA